MLPFPEEQSMDDSHAWLRDGWFCREDGHPLRFYDAYEDTIIGMDYASTGRGERHSVQFDDVRVHWPKCGAVNLTHHAVFVDRIAERQWTQTYRSRSVVVKIPGKWHIMREIGVENLDCTDPDAYELVHSLFTPLYPSLPMALNALRRGIMASVAITPHLTLVKRGDDTLVYHRTRLVAELVGGRLNEIGGHSKVARLTKHLGGMFQ